MHIYLSYLHHADQIPHTIREIYIQTHQNDRHNRYTTKSRCRNATPRACNIPYRIKKKLHQLSYPLIYLNSSGQHRDNRTNSPPITQNRNSI